MQAVALIISPQLEKGAVQSQDLKEEKALENVVQFLAKNAELTVNEKNAPALLSNLRSHPGMILAVEVAKLVSFSELYELIIRVLREIILGETGGVNQTQEVLKAAFAEGKTEENDRDTIMPEDEDIADPDTPAASSSPSSSSSVSSSSSATNVAASSSGKASGGCHLPKIENIKGLSDVRVLFDLKPYCYDTKGKAAPVMSTKSRSHSYIADILILPFLKGLYEARAAKLDTRLAVDEVFAQYAADINEKIPQAYSLDVKLSLRKRIETMYKMQDVLVFTLCEAAEKLVANKNTTLSGLVGRDQVVPDEKLQQVLDKIVDSAEKLLMDREELEQAIQKDLVTLQNTRKKRPGYARRLIRKASDAPPNVRRAPPSPWTEFMTKDLKTMQSVLKAGFAVASSDSISWIISTIIVKFLVLGLPLKVWLIL